MANQVPEPLDTVAERAILLVPTMAGFTWWDGPGSLPSGQHGDAWCVRDSLCELFGWPVGGSDWKAFIEGPHPDDMQRLEEHLGLVPVDPRLPDDVAWFEHNRAHPGIVAWNLHSHGWTHFCYARDLRVPPPLQVQYRFLRPALAGFLVDVRQSPRG